MKLVRFRWTERILIAALTIAVLVMALGERRSEAAQNDSSPWEISRTVNDDSTVLLVNKRTGQVFSLHGSDVTANPYEWREVLKP